MEKKDFIKRVLAGVFFVVGTIGIIVVVFVIGREKGLTQPKFQASILFRDVGGLIEGAPVRLAGVNVGTVANIAFLEKEVQGRRVNVTLNIFDRYKGQLDKSVQFAIKTEGILGEKLVEINVIEGVGKTDLTQPVIGDDSLNVQELAQVFADAAQSFTKTSEDLNKVDIKRLSEVLADTAQSLSTTAEGVNKILTEMQYIAIKSKRLLNRLEQKVIEGDLFKVF